MCAAVEKLHSPSRVAGAEQVVEQFANVHRHRDRGDSAKPVLRR